MKLAFLLSFLGLAAAVPSNPGLRSRASTKPTPDDVTRRVLIGAPNKLIVADLKGEKFTVQKSEDLSDMAPSWPLFQEPNVIYAFDENSDKLLIFSYNPNENSEITLIGRESGAKGVVHLAMNKAGTRMLASSYTDGIVEIWDTSKRDGSVKRIGELKSTDPLGNDPRQQDGPHPHQAVLDPTGDFFVVNDLATDSLLVIDARDDDIKFLYSLHVEDGCGPRHGAFHGQDSPLYSVACELSNVILTYEIEYSDDKMKLVYNGLISTFGPEAPPKNATSAAAGELIADKDGKHLYVSNRQTGWENDCISYFNAERTVEFWKHFPSKALNPRMMSLSSDEKVLFVANQGMEKAGAKGDPEGLYAFQRAADGSVNGEPLGHADLTEELGSGAVGPQFVSQLPMTQSQESSAVSSAASSTSAAPSKTAKATSAPTAESN